MPKQQQNELFSMYLINKFPWQHIMDQTDAAGHHANEQIEDSIPKKLVRLTDNKQT
jgi:hypothetical protein